MSSCSSYFVNNSPKIIVLYSTDDEKIIDLIDVDFKKVGVSLIRLKNNTSLTEFVEMSKSCDYILVLISNSFLKSKYYMEIVHEVFQESNSKDKILQVLLEDVKIFKNKEKFQLIKYWKNKLHNNKNSSLDVIYRDIVQFINKISDQLAVPFSTLIESGYKEIFDYIGFINSQLVSESIKITKVEDEEEQNIRIDQMISENPSNYFTYFIKAGIALDRKKYLKAICNYSFSINCNPSFSLAYINRGVAHKEYGNINEAISDFDTAISLQPTLTQAIVNKGVIYKDKGDYEQAIRIYNIAIEQDPIFANAYINRGLAFQIIENYDEAICNYNKAIELNHGSAEVYCNLGYSYLLKDIPSHAEALKCLNKAIELKPNLSEAYCNRGFFISKIII
jgi:tetratricopeptide (TPR) repeat protein